MESQELAALYDAHADAVFGFLLSMTHSEADSRDIMQDLFVKMGRGKGSSTEIRNPRAYLLRAAHRLVIDASRRREVRRRNEGEAGHAENRSTFCPESDPDREAFRQGMEAALAELPEEQRAAVHLKLWGGLSFEEIAQTLGINANTAASRYRYGVDKLRERLRPLYDEIK